MLQPFNRVLDNAYEDKTEKEEVVEVGDGEKR